MSSKEFRQIQASNLEAVQKHQAKDPSKYKVSHLKAVEKSSQ
jgi:hypothetical protein